MPTLVATPGNYDSVNWATSLVLQANDKVEYVVAREVALMSKLIKDMVEDQAAGEQLVIPLPNISGQTLRYVIEYCEHHYNNPPQPIEKPLKTKIDDYLSEWDKKFIFGDLVKGGDETQHELLIDVVLAANFLNIQELLHLGCATMGSMIRGKTAEQVKELFHIVPDFTEEEIARIKEENAWCEE